MKSAGFLKHPLPDPDQLATDILRMQNARTWSELEVVCGNIEARHTVEGVSPSDQRAYELIKTRHAQRVSGTLNA